MRHLHFYLLGFAALLTACQPVTPTTVNTEAAPTITVTTNGQTEIDLVVSTVTKATDSEAGSGSGSSTNDITEETVIAAIPPTPPVQPTFRPKAMIGSVSII